MNTQEARAKAAHAMTTNQKLNNALVKLHRCEGWIDPISGYHAVDILSYIFRLAEEEPDIQPLVDARLRKAGLGCLVD